MSFFEVIFSNSFVSLGLGLVSWMLPIVYLFVKKRRDFFTCSSLTCVVFSLYFQLREVARLTDQGDWSSIEDTIHAVVFVAGVLIFLTLILNILAWCKKR